MINPEQDSLLAQLIEGEELPPDHLNKLTTWASNLPTSSENSENNEEPKKKKRKLNSKKVIIAEKDATSTQEKQNTETNPQIIINHNPVSDSSESIIKNRINCLRTASYFQGSADDDCVILYFASSKSLQTLISQITSYKNLHKDAGSNADFERFFKLGSQVLIIFDLNQPFCSPTLNWFFLKQIQIQPYAAIPVEVVIKMRVENKIFSRNLTNLHNSESNGKKKFINRLDDYFNPISGKFFKDFEARSTFSNLPESNIDVSQPMLTSANMQSFWNTNNTPSIEDVPADEKLSKKLDKSEKLVKKITEVLSLVEIKYYAGFTEDHCIIKFNNTKNLESIAKSIQRAKKFPSVDNNPDFKRFFSLSDSIMIVFHQEPFVSSELNEFFKEITVAELEWDDLEFIKTEAMKSEKILQSLINNHQSEFKHKNSHFYRFFRYYKFPGGDFFKYIAGKHFDPTQPFEPGAEKIIHFLEQAELCCPGINSDHFIFQFSDPEILKKFNTLLNNYMNRNLEALSFEDRSRFFKLGNYIMIVFWQEDLAFNSATLQRFFTTEIKISDRDENLEAIKNCLPGEYSFQPLKGHSKSNDERNEYFLKLEKYYNPTDGLFFEYYEPLQIVSSLQKRQTLEETSGNPMDTQFTSDTNPNETESSKQEMSDEEETISQIAQEINPDDIDYLELPLSPKF